MQLNKIGLFVITMPVNILYTLNTTKQEKKQNKTKQNKTNNNNNNKTKTKQKQQKQKTNKQTKKHVFYSIFL